MKRLVVIVVGMAYPRRTYRKRTYRRSYPTIYRRSRTFYGRKSLFKPAVGIRKPAFRYRRY